jgi:hypothetical protein
MRRFVSALALGMLVAGLMVAPAAAKASNVSLAPIAGLAGGGTVIFNNSSGPNNLEVTVQLKAAPAATTYAVYLFVDGAWYGGAPVGTMATNGAGNATFHINVHVSTGAHALAVDVAVPVTGADQYLTSPWGTVVMFK